MGIATTNPLKGFYIVYEEVDKRYYRNHKKQIITRQIAINQKRVVRNRLFVIEYLKYHPCVDCGEADVRVLEFDHRDKNSKKSSIVQLVAGKYSLKALSDEIAKCDVRCANCHRKRTVEQLGWYRSNGAGHCKAQTLRN